jgi:hypothetical protein
MLNEHLIKYIEKEVTRLIDLIKPSSIMPSPTPSKPSASGLHHPILTLSNATNMTRFRQDNGGNVIAIESLVNGVYVGFADERYKEFSKFVTNIYNDRIVSDNVSHQFIQDKCYKWLIDNYQNKTSNSIFSSYLLSEIDEVVKDINVFFRLHYLDIEKPFQIGDVHFLFLTADYFVRYEQAFAASQPDMPNPYSDIAKTYADKVYVSCSARGDKNNAVRKAFIKCSLAIDTFKVCFHTIRSPEFKMYFDIDSRIRFSDQSEVLLQHSTFEEGLSFSLSRKAYPYLLSQRDWKYINGMKLEIFSKFLAETQTKKILTEIESLVVEAIKRLANALSNHNLHQRVTELFTILESLLLLDQNSPIIDTICKYGSKLVYTQPDDRKSYIKVLKQLYEVRSSYMHHAKEKPFELSDLKLLQLSIHQLLLVLIGKVGQYVRKEEILKEIDEAILRA